MSKRIKILFTTSNFDTAGSGKVIFDLVNGLDTNKFHIEIACSHNRGNFFKTIEGLGYPIHIFETKTDYRPYHTLPARIYKISKFLKRQDYDIVHSWQWSNDWTEAIATQITGAKWIYTKKAMGFKSKHWHIKSFLANFIVTINDEMQSYFPYKKSQRLIPLGIDTDYYSPKVFPRGKETKKFRIITVANLVPVKGVEVLLNAINNLNDLDISLTIVGDCDNDYGKEMISLTQTLNLTKHVHFFGKQSDVRPFISEADLYVIPTLDQGRKEGMPMALVEAMSMGIPVVGSDISGIKFVLKDFEDLLFKAGDSKALEQIILKTKNLPFKEQQNIGTRLRNYCIENFTVDLFTKAHEQLYFQLLNQPL